MSALNVNHLYKSFGGLRVASDINLAVESGERRLIIGPNGAGKTTLFNLIMGELTPDGGSIHLFDRDITDVPSRRRAHLGMTRTYQIITLFPRDSIQRNVTLALLGLSSLRWNPLKALHRQNHLVEDAHAALARVGLDHIASRPLSTGSGGGSRSQGRWRRIPGFFCWTSRSPDYPSTSGATSTTCCSPFRAM